MYRATRGTAAIAIPPANRVKSAQVAFALAHPRQSSAVAFATTQRQIPITAVTAILPAVQTYTALAARVFATPASLRVTVRA